MSDLSVSILWHLHQPSYWDPITGRYRYPWVFMHAARHYHAMAYLARRHPEMRMAVNITPVLVEQLEHYASGGELKDRLLEAILRPAENVTEVELELVLDHVFKLHVQTMIAPFPRYRELYGTLGNLTNRDRRREVNVRDLRDLQVLYLLTWCGLSLRADDPVRSLIEKGSDYTEQDKEVLFRAMRAVVSDTCKAFRELQDDGLVELTTTPYYHPILPLVIDATSAKESRPEVDIDGVEYRYARDARWHVDESRASYEKLFGCAPRGMWPAEGGVSDAALQMIADAGFLWAGTDEGILERSVGGFRNADHRYRPYRFLETDLWVYFRDRELSDRIGFVYSGWKSEDAVNDLIHRLLAIRNAIGDDCRENCVTLILDGENPWEYYPDLGEGFLSGLYSKLVSTNGLTPARFCDHRMTADHAPSVRHIVPGSWIYSNFDTWIGCPEKNHAWKVLAAARHKLEVDAPDAEPPREIYRAEGSDWFWWLGPGHDTPYEASYENIFRLNLRNGLEKCGVKPPAILQQSTSPPPSELYRPPLYLTRPTIDGRKGSYYDWLGAGFQKASEGSFHRARRHLESVRFGFDGESLFLRIDGDLELLRSETDALENANDDVGDAHAELRLHFDRPGNPKQLVYSRGELEWLCGKGKELEFHGRVAHREFLELAVPFADLEADVGESIEFFVALVAETRELDRLPQSGHIMSSRPGADYGLENWSV